MNKNSLQSVWRNAVTRICLRLNTVCRTNLDVQNPSQTNFLVAGLKKKVCHILPITSWKNNAGLWCSLSTVAQQSLLVLNLEKPVVVILLEKKKASSPQGRADRQIKRRRKAAAKTLKGETSNPFFQTKTVQGNNVKNRKEEV